MTIGGCSLAGDTFDCWDEVVAGMKATRKGSEAEVLPPCVIGRTQVAG